MSGNRNRNSAGSRFSLGGSRLFHRSSTDITISSPYDVTTPTSRKGRKPNEPISAAESVLQRSATDTLFGNAYHETLPNYQEVRKPNEKDSTADSKIQAFTKDANIHNSYESTKPASTKSASQDVRQSDKSKSVSFGTRLRSAAGKASAKIKGLGSKTAARESGVSLSTYPKKAQVKSQEAVTGLRPNVLHADPLGLHPKTMTFSNQPKTPPTPRVQLSQETNAEEEEDSDDESWKQTLIQNALYSASMGELNLTPRKSPLSAKNPKIAFDSPLPATDEDDQDDQDDLSAGLLTPTRASTNRNRSKDLGGSGRSISGLGIPDTMASLLRKPTRYSRLPEEKLTPIKEHAPVVSSPLRRGNSSDSLGSLEQEALKQAE